MSNEMTNANRIERLLMALGKIESAKKSVETASGVDGIRRAQLEGIREAITQLEMALPVLRDAQEYATALANDERSAMIAEGANLSSLPGRA